MKLQRKSQFLDRILMNVATTETSKMTVSAKRVRSTSRRRKPKHTRVTRFWTGEYLTELRTDMYRSRPVNRLEHLSFVNCFYFSNVVELQFWVLSCAQAQNALFLSGCGSAPSLNNSDRQPRTAFVFDGVMM